MNAKAACGEWKRSIVDRCTEQYGSFEIILIPVDSRRNWQMTIDNCQIGFTLQAYSLQFVACSPVPFDHACYGFFFDCVCRFRACVLVAVWDAGLFIARPFPVIMCLTFSAQPDAVREIFFRLLLPLSGAIKIPRQTPAQMPPRSPRLIFVVVFIRFGFIAANTSVRRLGRLVVLEKELYQTRISPN